MSQVIDRKIVDMEFNNSRFEANVSQTMSTLDKLKQKLNFGGMEKTFDTLEASSENIKMDGLRGAIETVSAKFSALEVIGVTALANITNSAINLGKNFIKSISLDQISSGWQKYADKTTAVQTIMAATREEFAGVDNQMELVEEQLERLNWFTDETSYKFVDMVSNIGKFTSAGVKLETATTAMQGIATWAAVSGANAEKASHAMYNLSQALGSGVVRLQDWKSIENANMSTIEFKNTAIEAALALGTLKKNSKGVIKTLSGKTMSATKDFNDSLKSGWLTADVLMKTLDAYGGFANKLKEVVDETGFSTTELLSYLDDYAEGTLDISKIADEAGISVKDLTKMLDVLNSDTYDLGRRAFKASQEAKTFEEAIDYVKEAVSTGWMKTFELIFGNYEKAKKLWSDVAENFYTLFVESGDNRNDLLRAALYKDEWDEFSESIEGSTIKMKDLSKQDRELAKSLDLTAAEFKGLKKMAKETGTPVEELAKNFKRISGSDLIVQSISNAFEALLKVIEVIKEAWADIFPPTTAEQLYGLIERFEQFTANLIITDEQAEKLNRTLKGLFAVLDIGWYIIQTISGVIKKLASAIFDFDLALDGTSKLGDFLVKIRNSIRENDRLGKILNGIADILVKIINYVKETIRGNTNLGKLIRTIYNSIRNVIDKFKEFRNKATEKSTIPKGSFLDLISKAFSGIKNGIEKLSGAIDKAWPNIEKIFSAIWNFSRDIGVKAFNYIKDFIQSIRESEAAQKAVAWISSSFASIVDFIRKTISGENEFGQVIRSVLSSIRGAVEAIISKIKELYGIVSEKTTLAKDSTISVLDSMLKGLKSVIDGIVLFVQNIWPTIKSVITSIGGFFTDVRNFLTEDGFKNSIGILKVAVLSAAFIKIRKSLKNISALVENLSTMFKSIGGAFSGLKKYLKTLENSVKYESIKNIALSLALLAGAFYLLSKITWKEFAVGIAALGSIIVLMGSLILLLNSKKIDEEKLGKATLAVLGISAAMVLFALAMKMLAKLSWEELAKGLVSIGAILAAFVFIGKRFDKDGKGLVKMAAAMIIVSFALLKLALGLKAFGSMRLDEIIKGLIGLSGTLIAVAGALNLIKGTKLASASLMLAASAILFLAVALKAIGSMDTGALVKAIASITAMLIALTVVLNLIDESILGAAALAIAVGSIIGIALAFKILEDINWSSIIKAFVVIAGTIAIIGVASAILGPLAPLMIVLGIGLAAVGVGLIAVGKGLQVLAKGLKAINAAINVVEKMAKAFIKAIEIILEGLLLLIPKLVKVFVTFIINTIRELLPSLAELIPMIVEFILKLAVDLLESLTEYIPKIVTLLVDFLIGIIRAITDKAPELIEALVDMFMAVLKGFADALKKMDPKILAEGLAAIGVMAAILAAMAALGLLAPAAMIGVLAFGVVITELAFVLALLSKLFEDPSLVERIRGSKYVLGAIGEAIGSFVGGLAVGMTDALPMVAENLSNFMDKLKPFLDEVKKLDNTILEKALMLPKILLAIMGVELLDSITAWLTGGLTQSVIDFSEQLVLVGAGIKKYNDEIAGIDPSAVEASASAALMITKFVNNIPREGGLIGEIFGTRGLPQFAEGLIDIGKSIASYYESIKNINPKTVEASASAALMLTEFAKNIPNQGGLISVYFGDNTLLDFAKGLIPLGNAIWLYYLNIKNIDTDAVIASANAAKVLAEFADNIPNQDGLINIFTGDNKIGNFAEDLPKLGMQLKRYANNIRGIDGGAVEASANAAKTLAELANNIPNEGGWFSKIFGDNDIAKFAEKLEPFGQGIQKYSNAIADVKVIKVTAATAAISSVVNIAKIIKDNDLTSAANGLAGKSSLEKFSESLKTLGDGLAEYSDKVSGDALNLEAMKNATKAMSEIVNAVKNIPESGDIFGSGGVDVQTFGKSLVYLGTGLSDYSKAITGENEIDNEAINASMVALKSFVQLSNDLKSKGDFLTELFGGKYDLQKFGQQIPYLGIGIAKYSEAINDQEIDLEKVSSSVDASIKISEIYDHLTKFGGVVGFITGDLNLKKFGEQLPYLGEGITKYWNSIKEETFSQDKIAASVSVGVELASLYDNLDALGGVVGFFAGEKDLGKFGEQLPKFANGIVEYCRTINTSGVSIDNVSVKASVEAAKTLAEIGIVANSFEDTNKLKKFGKTLPEFAESLKSYAEKAAFTEQQRVDIENSVGEVGKVVALMNDSSALPENCTKNFIDGLNNLGAKGVNEFAKAFDDGHSTIRTAAENAVQVAVDEIRSYYQKFCDAGKYAISGFVSGLKDKISLNNVENAGWNIGRAALRGTQNALDSHSPSKEYEKVGTFCPAGLYKGVVKNLKYSELAGKEIGEKALNKTKKILSNISTVLDENINTDPIIRPVLDLDNIETGAGKINALLSTDKAYSIQAKSLDIFGSDGEASGNGPVNNWNFTQNNYSPKSLSSAEIYRQTKNQFSALKRRTS